MPRIQGQRSKTQLSDPYVKFFRWATDRLAGHDGIVCFVSNNSFVISLPLMACESTCCTEFSTIYHLDLQGNVRQNPTLSGTQYNVFGIQVGVGITVGTSSFTRNCRTALFFHRVDKQLRRSAKLSRLRNIPTLPHRSGPSFSRIENNLWLASPTRG